MSGLAQIEGYYDGLNQKLFDALPPARRVLELGCANGLLGRAYKQRHPGAHWTGVDKVLDALAAASSHLDHTIFLDLDTDQLSGIGDRFDLIVFGDLIEHLKSPREFLTRLRGLVAEDGRLVCCIPNMNHVSVVERLLIGDLCYDRNGLLDDTHLRLFSPASAIKTLLDGGWIPSLADSYVVGGDAGTLQSLGEIARRFGCSAEAFERNLLTYQMIFDCMPARRPSVIPSARRPSVSVVVPVTNPMQYSLNAARSPGFAEIGAELVPVHGATSAADGFAKGRDRASGEWIVYSHQDVYLPAGAGAGLAEALEAIPEADRRERVLGVIGLVEAPGERFQQTDGIRAAGTVVDRVHLMRSPPADNAISIDECMVVLHRDSTVAIDPALGWHLWATDLVWQARARASAPTCTILDLPVFHNSLSGWSLGEAFDASRDALFRKYPEQPLLHSLCGTWTR